MRYLFPLAICLLIFGAGCDDDNGGSGNACNSEFDQRSMLQHYADNVIIPTYTNFAAATANLEDEVNAFLADPSSTRLTILRSSFDAAFLAWQTAEPFNFGPAAVEDYRAFINPFPTDEGLIDELLLNGVPSDYDFTFDQGLPALDYLLYGLGDDDATITAFTDVPENENARNFLQTQASRIKEISNTILTGWASGYRDAFIANTGQAAGTGVSLLINSLNEHWERTKRERIGTPAGVATLVGVTFPEAVEALHSKQSLALLRQSVTASFAYFNGRDNGLSLADYLDEVGATKSGAPLSQLITDKYTEALGLIDLVEGPLAVAVDDDQEDVTNLYASLVQNIVLLKTDMPSVLCVAITYVDNPSDSD